MISFDGPASPFKVVTAYVCEEALAAARELVADGVRGRENRTGWRFEICDETGAPVLMVPFSEAIRESGG